MKAFLITALFLFSFWFTVECQVPVGETTYRCSFCGKWFKSYASGTSHLCSVHNYSCNSGTPVQTGPSPEELRKNREAKDLKEASEDANDKGIDCYKRKDWNCAIKYFSEALDYDEENGDANDNLKKAYEEARKEKEAMIKKAMIEVPVTQVNSFDEKYRNYMKEIDNIVVPPPSWESMIAMQAEQIRIGQKNENYLIVGSNAFAAAFDVVNKTPVTKSGTALLVAFKMLVIGAKSTIAAQQEAEIIIFTKNATYERVLLLLKDKKQGPQIVSIIKNLRENKPPPQDVSPDLIRLVIATQQPEKGISSVRLVMNAMLSKEAKGAFFQTAQMEAMEMVSSGIRGIAGTTIQNRFSALREVNEKINIGQKYLSEEKNPLAKSLIQNQLEKLEKKMQPFEQIPEQILSLFSLYDDIKKVNSPKK